MSGPVTALGVSLLTVTAWAVSLAVLSARPELLVAALPLVLVLATLAVRRGAPQYAVTLQLSADRVFEGDAVTVARWPVEVIPNVIPGLPPEMPAEAVPTTVAIGPDGWAYVGQLIGFPGTPGTAHIWRVNPNAEDAVCDVEHQNADCSV